ncbi:retinol dehydrogenase 14 isoform X2 [Manduca sexta]|nr:retinol dehydrogenase 14 isoform X2 [Manduca sexta]XP_030029750.1 retinol dehydrogenase 14 isoform X2 [Manduca sexta]XP_037300092.1 retinol dehydrogenase 14 isoform X2 [Manduca sexta]KAG6455579.1 hypothetical protein O3G_MSEX009263 [Manduca sexta]
MACRNIEKAEKAKKEIIKENVCKAQMGSLAIEYLDLCSLKSIRSCANRILEKEPNINILINNAGVMMCPESKTEDGFEKQFGSNHLGHAYLTLLLLPRLIKSAPSRIIFVSSLLHCIYTENFDDINYEGSSYSSLFAYACSKTANIVFAKALAMKLKEHNIHNVTTYSLHPGVVKTNINQYFDKTAFFLFNSIFNSIFTTCFWKTPRCGAQTSIYCAVDEDCAGESGLYYSDCAKAMESAYCRDEKRISKLWEITIKMLKLESFYSDGNIPVSDLDLY